MRRIILIIASAGFLTATLPQTAMAQNSGFIDSLNDLFQGKDKKKKKKAAQKQSTRVTATQKHLNTLGFDAGTPDGISGAQSRRAISAYQASRGFPETGRLTNPEFTALKQDAAAALATQTDNATMAQAQLAVIGFYTNAVDGNWGPESQEALETFRSFTALPLGGPLNDQDMTTLQEAVVAINAAKPDAPNEPFDTIVLFGNEFALSEPAMGPTKVTWADVKQHAFIALPQSQALMMEPDAASELLGEKTKELSGAYQAQIDILYALMKPQIQTYVEDNHAAADVASTVANYDIEIASLLIGGKGADMIDLWGITIPGMDGVITLAQSTTHQLQALQAIEASTLSVTKVGF